MTLEGARLQQLAAAHVLGALSSRTRRRFDALEARDVRLRRARQEWERRLSRLVLDIPPIRPEAGTVQRVLKRIDAGGSSRIVKPAARRRWVLIGAVVAVLALLMLVLRT
jgi:anti-sigma-K factor RskA